MNGRPISSILIYKERLFFYYKRIPRQIERCFNYAFLIFCPNPLLKRIPRNVSAAERFYMTSWQPYWCFKRMKRRPCWLTNPVRVKLSSYLNTTFCSNKYSALLIDVLNNFDLSQSLPRSRPGDILTFMDCIGMCSFKECGFYGVLVINWISIWPF